MTAAQFLVVYLVGGMLVGSLFLILRSLNGGE